MVKEHYSVYVIELKKALASINKFKKENPDYEHKKPCVYVGMTWIDIKERFENHKSGYKSSRFVKKFRLELMPKLYEQFNPMSYRDALKMEKSLAGDLRKKGYGVWQK